MKKIVLAGLTVAAVAATSMAADVKISGEYRVRAFSQEGFNLNTTNGDQDQSRYYDNRLRMFANIKASDAATITLRSDVIDGTFGQARTHLGPNYTTVVGNDNGGIQLERAFVTLKLPNNLGTAVVGRADNRLLKYRSFIDNSGYSFAYAKDFGVVALTATTIKVSENGDASNTDGAGDHDIYAMKATFKPMDGVTVTPFAARSSNKNPALNLVNEEIIGYGFEAYGKFGMVGVEAFAAMFDGETGAANATSDITGSYFRLAADVAPLEGLNVGVVGIWIEGQDNSTDTAVRYIAVSNEQANSEGYILTDGDLGLAQAGNFAQLDGSNRAQGGLNLYKLYASYKVAPKVTVGGSFIYATEDTARINLNGAKVKATEIGTDVAYKLYDNVTLSAFAAQADFKDIKVGGQEVEKATELGMAMHLKF